MLWRRMDTTDARPGETVTALLSAIGDACVSCGAGLQADQRYCVECGVRNAPPRLAFMDGRTRPQVEPPVAALAAPGPAVARRPASGMTLIAGVATLLLAMGVGVLIGAAGSDAPTPAAGSRVQVVSVPAAAPVAAAPAAGTTTTSTTPSTASTTDGDTAKKAAKPAASSSSAKKVTTPKPVKVGSKGHGPGYKNGKFTGNFFGP
jgi:hypothetical protein